MVRFLGVVIGLVFLITMLAPMIVGSSETLNLQIEVTMACENFVKERLKAPGSAKFAGLADQEVFSMPDGSYSVLSWVDSQNSFGEGSGHFRAVLYAKAYRLAFQRSAKKSGWLFHRLLALA